MTRRVVITEMLRMTMVTKMVRRVVITKTVMTSNEHKHIDQQAPQIYYPKPEQLMTLMNKLDSLSHALGRVKW